MNEAIILMNSMGKAVEEGEYEIAMAYAQQLDKIVGYKYYSTFVENQIKKEKIRKLKVGNNDGK